VIVLSVILAILLFVRSKRFVLKELVDELYWHVFDIRKQNKEYVRLAIEQSLNRQVVIGPSIEDRRGLYFIGC